MAFRTNPINLMAQRLPGSKRGVYWAGLLGAISLLAGCNSGPSTVVVMQITNTPDPRMIVVTVTNTSSAPIFTASPSAAPVVASVPTTAAPTVPPVTAGALPEVAVSQTLPATSRPVAGATLNPALNPTETRRQVTIAQEDFQYGYMFWIQATNEIWVLLPSTPGTSQPASGQYEVFKDTFANGESEVDDSLTPPAASLIQPKRGFGKVWRTNTTVRGALGWGTTPEFGLNTTYVYQPGGSYDATVGQWSFGPGTHFLISMGRQTFAFHEGTSAWERVG